MNDAHTNRETAAKASWTKPEIESLDVRETANGMTGPDGAGGGSQQGGNSSGS